MKVSKFTRYTEYENDLIVYNTFNGGLGAINKQENPNEYDIIKSIIDQGHSVEDVEALNLNKDFLSNFCVADNVDEINMLSVDYLSRNWDPCNLYFICVVNNYCNFICNYCYESHDKKEFSTELLENLYSSIINYSQNYQLNKIGIEWYGGEPLLSKDKIVSFTKKLNEYCIKNNIAAAYAITTNGYELTPDVAKTFLEIGIKSFQITIDGNEELHNKLRPLKSGKGTWKQIMDNLKFMATLPDNFHVMIRVNYTFETLEHFDELLDFIDHNFDRDRFSIFFHGISDWGGKSKDNINVVDDGINTFIACEMIERTIQKGINITRLNTAFSRYGKVCYASIPNHFVISSDGLARKCTFDMPQYDSFNHVGDINSGYLNIDRMKSCNFEAPKYFNKKCINCDILPICMNLSCPKTNLYDAEKECTIDRTLIDKVYEAKYRLLKNGKYTSTKLIGLLY